MLPRCSAQEARLINRREEETRASDSYPRLSGCNKVQHGLGSAVAELCGGLLPLIDTVR